MHISLLVLPQSLAALWRIFKEVLTYHEACASSVCWLKQVSVNVHLEGGNMTRSKP